MRLLTAAPFFLALASVPSAHGQETGDVKIGRDISARLCTRCHVVGKINPGGGISSTPSFQMLVRRRPDYKDRFQTFFARRPHPAFISIKGVGRIRPDLPPNAKPEELTEDEIAHIVAFAESLEPKSKAERDKARKPLVLTPRPKPRMR